MDNNLKNKMITAMVFLAEDTNGMVIHLNGFDNPKHANTFVKKSSFFIVGYALSSFNSNSSESYVLFKITPHA